MPVTLAWSKHQVSNLSLSLCLSISISSLSFQTLHFHLSPYARNINIEVSLFELKFLFWFVWIHTLIRSLGQKTQRLVSLLSTIKRDIIFKELLNIIGKRNIQTVIPNSLKFAYSYFCYKEEMVKFCWITQAIISSILLL